MPARFMKETGLMVPESSRPRSAKNRSGPDHSESVEEYIEGIYRLQEVMERVGTGDIARYMKVQPASVTTMLRRLADAGLVTHTPYGGVCLTDEGQTLALSMLRRHRLVERLLVDFLQLPWEDVHDLACKLEHHVNESVAQRISQALGNPSRCPHGNPIDATATDDARRLMDLSAGTFGEVLRISDERTELLTYVQNAGLLPGVRFHVSERSPFNDVVTLEVEGQSRPVSVGNEIGRCVWVLTHGGLDNVG